MSLDAGATPTRRTHPFVLAALATVALFFALRTHTEPGGWNDTSRLGMVEAIVERGHLWLDGTAMGRRSGDVCMIDGHYYSDKPPAVALLAVPVYAAETKLGITFTHAEARAYYWTTLLTIGLSTLLGLIFLERFLRRVVPSPAWRALTVLGLGLGSLNTAFSVTFSNHPPSGTLLLVGILLVWWWGRYDGGLVRLALGGFAIGVAATADHGAAFYLPFVGLYALWPLSRRSLVAAIVVTVAASVPLAAYAVYAYALTGSPMPLPLQPRLFDYPGSYWSQASGHLPGSSFAHDSLASLGRYVWLCLFGERGLFSHTPILLFVVAAMLRLAWTRAYPRRAEIALVLLPTAVLMTYYFVTSDNPGGNSYGVRWYCLFIPLLFVFLADAYATLRTHAARAAFWIAYALSFPLAIIGSLAPWLDPTDYGTGYSWVLVLRAKGWL